MHDWNVGANEMSWLSSNWIWLVLVGGMLWMHLGTHLCCQADLAPGWQGADSGGGRSARG